MFHVLNLRETVFIRTFSLAIPRALESGPASTLARIILPAPSTS